MEKLRNVMGAAQAAAIAAALVSMLLAPMSAAANGAEAKLQVSATVLKRASLKVVNAPSAVVITAADIARGYVDAPAPAQVDIQSNSLSGYAIEFASEGEFMRQILVKGLANDVQLSPAGGSVAQYSQTPGMTKTTLALGFRFMLAQSTVQGTYPWPVRLTATPL
ncbi:MAG: hypothetical protein H0X13_13850 [Ramlibacter sp.]|nr:hypothetical protein [Ramlibacter sp.]